MGPQEDSTRGIRNEERLNANDRMWIAHEEAQRLSWDAHATVHEMEAQALRLQFTETMRRLDELNHAHSQRVARDADFVSNEVYLTERRSTETRLKLVEDWKNRAMGAAVILTLVSGAVGAVIAKALG